MQGLLDKLRAEEKVWQSLASGQVQFATVIPFDMSHSALQFSAAELSTKTRAQRLAAKDAAGDDRESSAKRLAADAALAVDEAKKAFESISMHVIDYVIMLEVPLMIIHNNSLTIFCQLLEILWHKVTLWHRDKQKCQRVFAAMRSVLIRAIRKI